MESGIKLRSGIWVRVEKLVKLDPRLALLFPEFYKNRKVAAYGVIIKELAGTGETAVIVDYRDPYGEPCGIKALHELQELKASYPLS